MRLDYTASTAALLPRRHRRDARRRSLPLRPTSAPVAVGDGKASILAEGFRGDAHPGSRLAPLVLVAVDHRHHSLDLRPVYSRRGDLFHAVVVDHIGFDDPVEE